MVELSKENRQLMLKNHELSDGFLRDIFMDKIRVRVARSVTFFLLDDGEEPAVTILHLFGGLSSCRRTQRYC